MHKRRFLQAVLVSGGLGLAARPLREQRRTVSGCPDCGAVTPSAAAESNASVQDSIIEDLLAETEQLASEPPLEPELEEGFQHRERQLDISGLDDESVDSYLQRIRHFDQDFNTDIYLGHQQQLLLESTLARLERVQRFVGHGNFNLLAFDEMSFFARNYADIGAFTAAELAFMDEIFHADASDYGFFGDKVLDSLTQRINVKDVVKITGSGHYLFQGESLRLFEQIRRDVGASLTLTSGIRNIVKQMHLFLAKVSYSNGNLSKASRSLAPPGYSYHGIGDFDVGKDGLGERNFTSHFSSTEEFQHMIRLGYVDIRYTDDNRLGVRYEPWHIKMA